MKKVLRITNPNVYAAYVNAPPLHPLVCTLRYEELGLFRRSLYRQYRQRKDNRKDDKYFFYF